MDVHLHSSESDSDDCSSFSDNLERDLDKALKIRDDDREKQRLFVVDNDNDSDDDGIKAFGRHRRMFDSSSSGDEVGESELSRDALRKVYELAMSLPSPDNLVSAMKGSREKVDGSEKNLTVKWAPDVYDPPPTQLELILSRGSNKQQKVSKREKKSGKKAQKGKDSSRGAASGRESSRGGGKDRKKKQHRGSSGGSRRYDVFADDGDEDGMESISSGFVNENSKDSARWLGKEKTKQAQARGTVKNLRRYDLPPSDEDEGDKEKQFARNLEADSTDSNCSSSVLKGSLEVKEVHHTVAIAKAL